jgi:hypothetical protein
MNKIRGIGAVDYLPGSEAPEDGVYEELIFGASTGITERVGKGERLPLAPRGYTWRTAPWTVGAAVRSGEVGGLLRSVGPSDRIGMPKLPEPFVGRD